MLHSKWGAPPKKRLLRTRSRQKSFHHHCPHCHCCRQYHRTRPHHQTQQPERPFDYISPSCCIQNDNWRHKSYHHDQAHCCCCHNCLSLSRLSHGSSAHDLPAMGKVVSRARRPDNQTNWSSNENYCHRNHSLLALKLTLLLTLKWLYNVLIDFYHWKPQSTICLQSLNLKSYLK